MIARADNEPADLFANTQLDASRETEHYRLDIENMRADCLFKIATLTENALCGFVISGYIWLRILPTRLTVSQYHNMHAVMASMLGFCAVAALAAIGSVALRVAATDANKSRGLFFKRWSVGSLVGTLIIILMVMFFGAFHNGAQ
jgi:hypothetical protein